MYLFKQIAKAALAFALVLAASAAFAQPSSISFHGYWLNKDGSVGFGAGKSIDWKTEAKKNIKGMNAEWPTPEELRKLPRGHCPGKDNSEAESATQPKLEPSATYKVQLSALEDQLFYALDAKGYTELKLQSIDGHRCYPSNENYELESEEAIRDFGGVTAKPVNGIKFSVPGFVVASKKDAKIQFKKVEAKHLKVTPDWILVFEDEKAKLQVPFPEYDAAPKLEGAFVLSIRNTERYLVTFWDAGGCDTTPVYRIKGQKLINVVEPSGCH
ncbi:MAG TPA: hypothetical protein VFV50_05715 [Bdellovibrionales bacterium]|nr:hypothetical protein [Bdellovibrionales bacterium]